MGVLQDRLGDFYRRIKSVREANQGLVEEARLGTILRIFWTAPIMSLGSFMIAHFFFVAKSFSNLEALWRNRIMVTHLSVAIASLLIWLGAGWLRSKARKWLQIIFQYFVVGFVLITGVAITIIDHPIRTSTAPLVITVTLVGTFYYLRPSRAIIAFSTAFAIFHFAVLRWIEEPNHILDSLITNALVACALGFSLSYLTWRNFRITQLQKRKILEQQVKLEKMAYQDPLTQLPNRRLLDEVLKREIPLVGKGQLKSSLLILDLDGFKAVNDTHGHPVGDLVLQEVASILQEAMGQSDTLVRLGGEEFVILASGRDLAEAVVLAERLREKIEKHCFLAGEYNVRLTASFGVGPILGQEESVVCYQRADQALYRAKELGKNRVETVGTGKQQRA